MTQDRTQEQKLRAKLDVIIACFILTSISLLMLGIIIVLTLAGVEPTVGLQTWAGVSLVAAIGFGLFADVLLLTDKLLLYRLFRRLNQPPR